MVKTASAQLWDVYLNLEADIFVPDPVVAVREG
jgi:hypothetical protein